ncbi:MAG: leucine-rich repeat domain-containing protein [Clostridia bacterium]|nr:leucine-rich repeat domain-containing protein [Clostridia bacterium]
MQSFVLKDGVLNVYCDTIRDDQFAGWRDIHEIVFHSEVKRIGEAAFAGCTCPRVHFKGEVEFIEECAFYGSTLEELCFDRTVYSIGAFAFESTNVEKVTFGGGVGALEECAFKGNYWLEKCHIPGPLLKLGDGVFQDCTELEDVSLGSSMAARMGERMFQNCSQLRDVILPPRLESIPLNTFDGCFSLEEVTMPNVLTRDEREQLFKDSYSYPVINK